MSRIFQDNDAKALIIVSALVLGITILGALVVPSHQAPKTVAESQPAQSPH
ncbi:MAG TPA: hypothetical protein V6C89_18095 [Drouetiella sp.]|jgi:hypothetical protein